MDNDQPTPIIVPGAVPIEPVFQHEVDKASRRQFERGIAHYGMPMMEPNGRDAYEDAMEEWVDLGRYVTQLRMERDRLRRENTLAWEIIRRLRGGKND